MTVEDWAAEAKVVLTLSIMEVDFKDLTLGVPS